VPEQPRPRSLRRRLLGLLLAATAVVWSAALIFSYFDTRREVGEMLDAHLAQSAALIMGRAGDEAEELDGGHAPQLHRYGRKVVFQIWENGNTLKLHSASAPNTRLSAQEDGFSDAQMDGKRWRVFSSWDSKRRTLVQVAERYSARDEIAEIVVERLVLPALIALPILALIIWLAVARGLKPLTDVGRQVARREPSRLEPLQADGVPAEVRPLVDSLNGLFARVTSMIENERRFTADAAHELRTPLAALRAQAQVARGSPEIGERNRALDNVITGCDRSAHLIEQLLTLARLDPGAKPSAGKACDLVRIAADAVGAVAPAAVAKGVELALSHTEPVGVTGDPDLLRILVRNLVDNAVRYSPAGTAVQVSVQRNGPNAELSVNDEGPGIPAAERNRVWDRFYRILGSNEDGSGLGLSIVRRIAELHGASVRLDDGEGGRGVRAVVSMPRCEP
jgi:two-component system, OmpR family, sensor histidine kinase QseC